MTMRFEWDAAKAATNLRKHAISFDIAMRVFADLSHSPRRFALRVANNVGKRWGSWRGTYSYW
jgi:uncharacterized DUF497 family protein